MQDFNKTVYIQQVNNVKRNTIKNGEGHRLIHYFYSGLNAIKDVTVQEWFNIGKSTVNIWKDNQSSVIHIN